MRILTGIDVPFRPFGGSLIVCDDWYSDLPQDVEARFLTLNPPAGQPKWWHIKDVAMLDVEKRFGAQEFPEYVRRLKAAVQQQIEEFKPDVIHAQHLNFGLSRVFADLAVDIPKLGICHGTDVQLATKEPFFKENLQRIGDAMDLLIFPNQNMADDFFKVYGREKICAINSLGIPDRFYKDALPLPAFDGKRPLKVLYAGRLLAWKGAHVAVRALKHTAHDMHLTVVGNEDEAGYKASMLDVVRENQLQDRVTFKDQMPREALLHSFADFDVMVFPSSSLEAFSLAAVEAQAAGLPIVVHVGGGGIADTVGDNALLIDQNTPERLAETLDTIYEHSQLLADLQAKGRANAEKYRLSASRERLLELSRQLLDQRRAP